MKEFVEEHSKSFHRLREMESESAEGLQFSSSHFSIFFLISPHSRFAMHYGEPAACSGPIDIHALSPPWGTKL
jgi:hypothetical protein